MFLSMCSQWQWKHTNAYQLKTHSNENQVFNLVNISIWSFFLYITRHKQSLPWRSISALEPQCTNQSWQDPPVSAFDLPAFDLPLSGEEKMRICSQDNFAHPNPNQSHLLCLNLTNPTIKDNQSEAEQGASCQGNKHETQIQLDRFS